jgi:hypothetical protein
MAYIIRNFDLADLRPSTGVGIKIPFDGPTGVTTTYSTKDAVKSNLLNYILTGKRERIFNPTFGSGLPELLFEPVNDDLAARIENLILGGVEQYFPRVIVNNIEINLSPDNSTVNIYMNYSVTNTNIEDEFELNINR